MQQLIASYLFQNKTCPLPGLGTLSVLHSGAEADFTNKTITSPKPFIQFTNIETNADGLVNYIAGSAGKNKSEIAEAFDHFCSGLKNDMTAGKKVSLDHIGNLSVDASGKISFKQEELPSAFLQTVIAERVIHPEAEHQILVGDRETTNTVMTEFLAPKSEIKEKWLVWAIVLGSVGLLMLVIYIFLLNGTSSFGNAIKI